MREGNMNAFLKDLGSDMCKSDSYSKSKMSVTACSVKRLLDVIASLVGLLVISLILCTPRWRNIWAPHP